MAKIVTVEEMVAIEKEADASGLSYDQMMQNAGRSIAQAIVQRLPAIAGKRVLILAGSGNNGGDGLVVAHHLERAGAQVSVYLSKPRPQEDGNLARLVGREILIANADDDQRYRVLRNTVGATDILVDALLGTGLELPLRGSALEILAQTQAALRQRPGHPPYVVAVDCPSGLNSDTGEIAEEALTADLTVTLAAAKQGLIRFPGAEKVGELVVGEIGLSEMASDLDDIDLELATAEGVAALLPARPRNSHKGTYGRAVIVGGSITLPGAAVLAGLGAYRVGTGLVTLAVPSAIQSLLAAQLPEATWILLPHEMGLLNVSAVDVLDSEMTGVDALLVGPGLGQDKLTEDFLARLLGVEVAAHRGKLGFVAKESEEETATSGLAPLVVDADALKLLVEVENWPQRLPANTILTPHPGEMAVLTGLDKVELQEDRVGAARQFAGEWGHVVVYKGAFTVVAAPDGRTTVLPFATSALATAGTGDVLAGAIVGLLAQGVEPYKAAVLGGFLHGRAGELAADTLGSEATVIAGDVSDALPQALSELSLNG